MSSWFLAFVLPIFTSAIALAIAASLHVLTGRSVFFLFVPAVMVSAWFGGRTGGIVATITALICTDLFLLPPVGRLGPLEPADLVLLVLFGAVCLSIGLLTAGRRRAEQERELALRAAETARRDAEISSRLKDQFLATLSHELRTPLNAVLGWARMLATGQLDRDKVAAALASIERNAHAQKQLVDDLLDVSAIVSGRLTLLPREIDLAEVVRGAVDSVRLSFDARHHHLEEHLERILIVGDADRLRQVVWNLLSNAAKFTPDGGDIIVRVARRGSLAQISVQDSGRGIGAEFLPYVFEPFHQADASITRASGGLGLGLSLVRHLVEAHGGTVSVTSEGARQGTTFIVSLPIAGMLHAPPDNAPGGAADDPFAATSGREPVRDASDRAAAPPPARASSFS